MTEKNVTVTVKTRNGSLVTIRGDEPQEFIDRVMEASTAGFALAVSAFEDLVLETNKTDAVNVVTTTLGATVIQEQPSSGVTEFAPVPPPQSNPGVEVITDRWGNRWTYGRPDAPVCPNGTMVLKEGTNQSGKSYKGWFDPAGGPKWDGPKIPAASQATPVWNVKA